jgi:hypothetical protein
VFHAAAMADVQSTTSMVEKRQLAAPKCHISEYCKRKKTITGE